MAYKKILTMDAIGQKNRPRNGLISRLAQFWKNLANINKRDERKRLTVRYTRYSTAQLLKIIEDRTNYTPLALELAFTELSSRDIERIEVESYVEQRYEEKEDTFIKTYQYDLTFFQKLTCFIFGIIPMVTYTFKQNFKENNYILKIEQATTYTLFGWISYTVSTIIVLFFFQDSNLLPFFAILLLLFTGVYIYDIRVSKKERLNILRDYYYWKQRSN